MTGDYVLSACRRVLHEAKMMVERGQLAKEE
jgi:hypothetical protein